MRGRAITAVTAASLTAALAGCTGSGHDAASSPRGGARPSSDIIIDCPEAGPCGPAGPGPAPPIDGAREGGTLTVLSHDRIGTLDPTATSDAATTSILSGLLVRSLTQYVYDSSAHAMILAPDLATNLGTPNRDFTSWTFTLRRGARFANGQPVTPEAMKFGIKRSFDRATFPDGSTYSNQYFLDGKTYRGPYRTPGPYPGVKIRGWRLILVMSKPFPDLPYFAASPAMSPIPPGRASDPDSYREHPWATGPYQVKTFAPGTSLTLVPNPYWDAMTDPGRHQYVDRVTFNFGVPSASIVETLLGDSGAGQRTLSYDSLRRDDYLRFKAAAARRLVLGVNSCTDVVYPDNGRVTDAAVRRALVFGYPYRAAWRVQGLIPGVTVAPATNVMPPGVPGRVTFNPFPSHPPAATDAVTARALLTRSGNLDYPLRFAYRPDDSSSRALKDVLVRALGEAGFRPIPVVERTGASPTQQPERPGPIVDLRFSTFCADFPSGSQWVAGQFDSRSDPTAGADSNLAAFSQPGVDRRIAAIIRLPLAEQPARWVHLEQVIQGTYVPIVVTGYRGVAMLRGSKVNSLSVDSITGMPTWKDIWLGGPQ